MEKKAVSLSTPLPNLPSQMLPETGHVRTSPAREKRATSEPRFFYLQNRNKTALTHSAVVPGQCISIGQVLGRYLAHSKHPIHAGRYYEDLGCTSQGAALS